MPQPSPIGDCMITKHDWIEEEVTKFSNDGTLPRDLSTIDENGEGIMLWLFDARNTSPLLPALELDPKPDFQKYPALCYFDMGNGGGALIPSEFLEMVELGGKTVQFVLNKEKGQKMDQYAMKESDLARSAADKGK